MLAVLCQLGLLPLDALPRRLPAAPPAETCPFLPLSVLVYRAHGCNIRLLASCHARTTVAHMRLHSGASKGGHVKK